MGGSGKKATTSSSGTVNAGNFTAEGFGKELGAAAQNASRTPQVFDKALYAGQSAQTKAAIDNIYNKASASTGMFDDATAFAQNLVNTSGDPSLTEQNIMKVANGDYLANGNPYFEANLAKAKDSTYADVMASLGSSGRTGSSVHMDELTGALGTLDNSARGAQYETERDRQMQALAAIEGTRQQGVANGMSASASLPGLYQASLLPGQTMLQTGQLKDADAQAQLMADYDLFTRKDPYTNIAKYMSLMNSSQNTQGIAAKPAETPWWQTVGSMVLGAF